MLWGVIISDDHDEETHNPVKLNVPNERMKKEQGYIVTMKWKERKGRLRGG